MELLTEENLLTALEAETIDCEELTAHFNHLCDVRKAERALEWAALVKDTLTDRKDYNGAVAIYEWIARKQDTSPAIAQKEILHILATSRKEQKFVEPAFEKASSLEEAFLRLHHLRAMKKGMLCYNATWGFGIIERIDNFYQKVEIEFEQKGDHELAFSYAAEALEVLTDDHLLAIRHNNPDEFIRLLKEDPSEIIRLTLRSYGPLSIQLIQEHLVPDMIPTEAEWKKFWNAARKALKNDPMIDIPSKRSEPLQLRKKALAYDKEWFAAFRIENDISALFASLEEIQTQKFNSLESYMAEAIADRLAFLIRGSGTRHPEWAAQSLVWAAEFGIEPANTDVPSLLARLARRFELLDNLPARTLGPFLTQLLSATNEAADTLLKHLPGMGTSALSEAVGALTGTGQTECVAEGFRHACRKRECSPAMLIWIHRHPEEMQEWSLIDPVDLTFQTLEAIEKDFSGEALRAQNVLRDRLESIDFLHPALDAMSDSQRRDFMRRVSESPAWGRLDRQSLQAKIIKHRAELHEIVLRKTNHTKEKKTRWTSERSYRAREAQLENILKKELPENAKEIELARSYGDLRENAEYKYAKEKQRLLGLQAEELQKALEIVKPTNFSEFPFGTAGIATRVELEYADSTRETYCILGEWDQDEALGIISCEAGMAKALTGAKAGSEVQVPAFDGAGVSAHLLTVSPLPENIKAWIKG